MPVLVIGGTGFIGPRITYELFVSIRSRSS